MNGEGDDDMKMEMKIDEKSVYMWGYLPGALPQRSPILSPVEVRLPQSIDAGQLWSAVCGGGCGFAMAISGWGSSFTFLLELHIYTSRIALEIFWISQETFNFV